MLQQPLRRARIEIGETLPVEGMPGVIVEVKVGTGDGGSDFLAHPLRREGIVFAANDECGALHVLKFVERVVRDGGSTLRLHGMHGLRCRIEGGVFESLLHVAPALIVVEPGLSEDEHLHVVHEVLGTHGGFALLQMFPSTQTETILPRPGTHEDHAFHLCRMTQRELLRNDRAERTADNAGLLDAELVHEPGIIIGHHCRGVGPGWLLRFAHAAVVTEDAAEMLLPSLCVRIPNASGSSHSHDADQRITAAAFLIKHFDSVGFDVGHGDEVTVGCS